MRNFNANVQNYTGSAASPENKNALYLTLMLVTVLFCINGELIVLTHQCCAYFKEYSKTKIKLFKDHITMDASLNTNICIELLNSMKKEKKC